MTSCDTEMRESCNFRHDLEEGKPDKIPAFLELALKVRKKGKGKVESGTEGEHNDAQKGRSPVQGGKGKGKSFALLIKNSFLFQFPNPENRKRRRKFSVDQKDNERGERGGEKKQPRSDDE